MLLLDASFHQKEASKFQNMLLTNSPFSKSWREYYLWSCYQQNQHRKVFLRNLHLRQRALLPFSRHSYFGIWINEIFAYICSPILLCIYLMGRARFRNQILLSKNYDILDSSRQIGTFYKLFLTSLCNQWFLSSLCKFMLHYCSTTYDFSWTT